MKENGSAKGSCLCGAVKLTTHNIEKKVSACHCDMCRKWTSGPLFTVDCGTDIEIEGSEHVTEFASSEWAHRAFCNQCGSNLYYKFKQKGSYAVAAGILNIESELDFNLQIFVDEKPNYYCFANETKNMTAAEVLAFFGNG